MVPLIGLAYFLVLGVYLAILLLLGQEWKNIPTGQYPVGSQRLPTTVLLPFRNEAKNMVDLLPHLLLRLPADVPLMLIDDHSEDDAARIVTTFILTHQLKHWRYLKSEGMGKKAALSTGIAAATTEILLTTDADVQLPEGWVDTMTAPFNLPGVQMVAGPVISGGGSGFFARFQQVEWASIILLTGISFHQKNPLMCSGANLAFRKEAFRQVGGYRGNAHLLSGDDEFLMKKVARELGAAALVYLPELDALVETQPLSGHMDWISQRSRWASKWNAHQGSAHWLSAGALALISLSQVLTWVVALISWKFFALLLIFWVGKFVAESTVLGVVLRRFNKQNKPMDFFLSGWLYPCLVLAALPFAILGKYSWKGRKN
ncbi:glycosyltransferase [Cyclobacterium plantarum]|uniref:Glycosyltransferase n=1 Tax=Cyclobacterium plantarum TaxID=2716263 RepID=A0ABX0HCA9_9BACT|nr:glycosyltransferase [Cyclobacterium plantarum]NHE59526.1 glycosyltransferase [Cyclobacterium plantarum]